MSRRHLTVLVPIVLVVLLAGLLAYAVAQQPGGGFQGGGGGQRGQGMRGAFMGMRGGQPAIAVANGAVFVVVGYSIYKFDADTLELLAQADIPRPQPPAGAMAPAAPAAPGQ